MKALKDPKVIAIVVVVVGLAAVAFAFRGALFGSEVAKDGTHINVVTGELHNWSYERYGKYRVEAAQKGRREIYPIERDEANGGWRIHGRYREAFLGELQNAGISAEVASEVVDLDTYRIRDKYVK